MTDLTLTDLRWAPDGAPIIGPINVQIRAGERVTVIGHHGSGKTTLLHLVAGTLAPTTGAVLLDGQATNSEAGAAAISTMLPPLGLADDRPMIEHLELAAGSNPAGDWRDDAVDLAGRLGLADRFDDPVRMFSWGMRQKLAICMAFVREFDVLILDEPFDGLDASSRRAALDLIDLAHEYGTTVIIATNDLDTAARGDRVIALRRGRLIADTEPSADLEALIDEPATQGSDADQEVE